MGVREIYSVWKRCDRDVKDFTFSCEFEQVKENEELLAVSLICSLFSHTPDQQAFIDIADFQKIIPFAHSQNAENAHKLFWLQLLLHRLIRTDKKRTVVPRHLTKLRKVQ